MTDVAQRPGDRERNADEALGRIIHLAMWERRITQTQLGAALGIDQTTVSKKLHGERPWSVRELIAVADYLHMDARDLLANMWGTPPSTPVGKDTVAYLPAYLRSVDGGGERAEPPKNGHLSLVRQVA